MKPAVILGAFVLTACATDPLAHLKHDPQEDDPRLSTAFQEATVYARRKISNDPPRLGEIHEVWGRYKKEYLLRKYGIHWKDPSEMNPNVAFD
jgi:hypothetical protein